MDVLEHQDRRVDLGDRLEERPPGGEELLALGARAGIDPHERPEALAQPIAVGSGGYGLIDLRARDLGIVGLEDPGLGLDDLAQRPERHPIAIRQAATLAPGELRRPSLGMSEEFGDDPALSDPWLPDHGDELDRARSDALVKEALRR